MFKVQHNENKEIFLSQESKIGFRLYSTTDGTGNGDFDISSEEYNKNYTVLEELED